jgi:hypothetical protein
MVTRLKLVRNGVLPVWAASLLGALILVAWLPAASHASPINLALGASTAGTSPGWGGGNTPSNLVDGISQYSDTWAHGVAFCGGYYVCAGGDRYAQINFLSAQTFDKVVVWHHGDDHFPAASWLEYWDGANWQLLTTTRTIGPDSDYHPVYWGSRSETLMFGPVSATAVRYGMNNALGQLNILGSQITHGWLYEVEVFEAQPVPEPATLALLSGGLVVLATRLRRRRSV